MADRHARVTWKGELLTGSGTIDEVGSAAFGPLPVSWPSRVEAPDGRTSPEELIAAAHASCYCMQLSHMLAEAGTPATELHASATVTFVPGKGITKSALTVIGTVPGIDDDAFAAAANGAKENCPVSAALRGNVELTVDAKLGS